MTEHCLELVVFKVKSIDKARMARRAAQQIVKDYDGFVSWTAYEACEENNLFADVVMWRDLPAAKKAADMIMKDPGFSLLMAQIDGMVTMAHYNADQTVLAPAKAA